MRRVRVLADVEDDSKAKSPLQQQRANAKGITAMKKSTTANAEVKEFKDRKEDCTEAIRYLGGIAVSLMGMIHVIVRYRRARRRRIQKAVIWK